MISEVERESDWSYSSLDYPEWLNSLCGESPLLESSEVEFIADVRSRMIKEAKSRPSFTCYDPLKHKLSIMKCNFQEVVKYLRKNSQAKDYFVQNYPEWRRFRYLTTAKLKDIAEAINVISRDSAEARTGGSVMSLIGGLLSLIAGGTMRLLGAVLTGFAALGTAATSILEVDLLRKKVKEAEKIILEDMEYSGKLWDWINDMSYLREAFITIEVMDVDKNLKKFANDLHACYKEKSSAKPLKFIIERAMESLKIPDNLIKESVEVIGILIAIFMLYDRYRPYFMKAYESYKCKKILSTCFNVIGDAVKMGSAISAGNCAKLTAFQKTQIGVGIVLNIISFILASEALGSMSKEAVEIEKVAENLKKEAEEFKKLYEAVNCCEKKHFIFQTY